MATPTRSLPSCALVLLAVAASACASTPKPKPPPEAPPPPVAPPVELEAATDQGVRLSDYQCQAASEELCDAVDNNCDGVIDEGCGYSTGAVQITLGWSSGADVDLYVEGPSGESIFYNEDHRRSASGGHMDHDARGGCRPQEHPNIENVYWSGERAPRGTYKVDVAYFGPCGEAGSTLTTISISIGGQVVGSFEYTLEPEQRVRVVEFTLK